MTNQLKGYVFYAEDGKIIPMSLILRRTPPKTQTRWLELSYSICCNSNFLPVQSGANVKLRAFVKFDKNKNIVAGSLIVRKLKPKDNSNWIEIPADICCSSMTTTTTSTSTSTSTSSSTTSTTTTLPG